MKLTRISSYFDYLRKEEEEIDFSEERILEVLKELNIEQYETVPDIPTRVINDIFTELIGGNKARRMDPNQEQDILDSFEESTVKGVVDKNVMAKFLRYILRRDTSQKTAFIVVDVQNDFIDGSLALKHSPAHQEGCEVVPVINDILENNTFDLVVYTIDWHPEDHCSFVSNIGNYTLHESNSVDPAEAKVFDKVVYDGEKVLEQVLWPVHCVQGSEGAQLHPDLVEIEGSIRIYKGTHGHVDSYSAFWDNGKLSRTEMLLELLDRDITTVICCGLATDFCVAYTAFDSNNHGFTTYVIEDACRGVCGESIEGMKTKERKGGIQIIESSGIPKIMES